MNLDPTRRGGVGPIFSGVGIDPPAPPLRCALAQAGRVSLASKRDALTRDCPILRGIGILYAGNRQPFTFRPIVPEARFGAGETRAFLVDGTMERGVSVESRRALY